MKKKKRIGKGSSKDYKLQEEIIEIFPGFFVVPGGSILNTECEVRVPYIRKHDPLNILRNFMNQLN